MTDLDLDAIKARVAERRNAIGPGGEKSWLAGLLAGYVPALVAEVETLRADRTKAYAANAALAAERDRLRADLNGRDRALDDLNGETERLGRCIAELEQQCDGQLQELKRLRAELEQTREQRDAHGAMADELRAALSNTAQAYLQTTTEAATTKDEMRAQLARATDAADRLAALAADLTGADLGTDLWAGAIEALTAYVRAHEHAPS